VSLRAPAQTVRRTRARVKGTVQGVGFRPYVYRQAARFGLSGFVLNDTRGVLLEVEGPGPAVAEFLARLASDAPPLAVLERILTEERDPTGERGFAIRESPACGRPDAPVTPDSATCADCLRELRDPTNRRYRYPFTNCTNCGPRFSIVRGVPYDRPLTTMAGFPMCPACRAEYDDPADRRFHAQPNACPVCGPVARLSGVDGPIALTSGSQDALAAAARALSDGAILAIKGIGGYHLACRADEETVVATLRARKHREDKPFALIVGSLAVAGALAVLDPAERELLASPAAPIVLAVRRAEAPVAPAVAPRARELGLMLPYAPLHHVLMADLAALGVDALVLTSGNVSDEPIAFLDDDAFERLGTIADCMLTHDRPIETRTDDSVVRVVAAGRAPRAMPVRRARGYVPGSLPVPGGGTPVPLLACGAELKNTFCLARGERAWVSHHIGDLENYETLQSFTDGIEHLARLFAVEPEVVVHDLHPEYLSTKYALERDGVRLIGVQHHHAHLAACLGEHGLEPGTRAVGAIFDGTGYGEDGTIWGGEFLCGEIAGSERVGALLPARLAGGERAIREPWRMACAWLSLVNGAPPPLPETLREVVDERAWTQVAGLVERGLRAPVTTSMGRLFDGVAALCGVCPRVNYEGQAAIEFEAMCDPDEDGAYPIELTVGVDGVVLDPRATVAAVLDDLEAAVGTGTISARFHAAIARGTVQACAAACSTHDADLVVLSGGVFQNRRLLEATAAGLHAADLRVLIPERLPVGDGGISYGQAVVAARRMSI
jgi:hydrogenase maturation protein HypF